MNRGDKKTNYFLGIAGKSIAILLLSTLAGFLLLYLIYMIPDVLVANTVEDLGNTMDIECPGRVDTRFFSFAYGCKNMPDTFIYDLSLRKDTSVLKAAMGGIAGSNEGDKRYWDGFMVIVRPLMAVFSYGQIRYLLFFIECILLWYVLIKLKDRIGWQASLSFLTGLVITNFIVNVYGLMLNMVFLIMFAFMAYFGKFYDVGMDREKLFFIFMANGILTTYLDRYTASLVTLEMPLLMILLINIRKNGIDSLKDNIYNTVVSIMGWGIGWSVFWINKWVLASVVLKTNVMDSAFSQASMRATTNADSAPVYVEGYKGGRLFTIAKNFVSLFPTHGENLISVILFSLIILAIMIIYLVKVKGYLKDAKMYLPVLILIVMPYIYYLVLSNLCQIHATFYMYRMQLVSIVGILFAYFEAISNGKKQSY